MTPTEVLIQIFICHGLVLESIIMHQTADLLGLVSLPPCIF